MVSLLAPLALTGCESFSEEFDSFCDEVLIEYFAGDQLTINLFFKDAAAYGFEHGDSDWYSYVKSKPGELEEIINENRRLLGIMEEFNYKKLGE